MAHTRYYPDECHEEIKQIEMALLSDRIELMKEWLKNVEGTSTARELNAVTAQYLSKISAMLAHYEFEAEAYLAEYVIDLRQKLELKAFVDAMKPVHEEGD